MSFSACAVVPCYNHGATVGAVVARLRAQGLPAIVVDDGSDEATAGALAALPAGGDLRVLRLAANSGKGAAVLHGIREASRLGFSHALQVDADGQHCIEDAPRFLEIGRAQPRAVVCGKPVYDDSAPRARLYGRYVSHVWVWIETLSLAIADSMCGFRLYPIDAVLRLAQRTRIATRMSFDTDIVVRLFWQGQPVVNLDTRVTYPPGGLSHFRLFRDNLRIRWDPLESTCRHASLSIL